METTETVKLMPYTLERCHEVYKSYEPDPMMTYDGFRYSKDKIDGYYVRKVQDPTRCFFAIVYLESVVGEIQLKYIDAKEKCGTLSIIIARDMYKNMGIGKEAIRLMLVYASNNLGLEKVYADAIHRNSRSQHVLEGVGFKLIRTDEVLKYYEYTFDKQERFDKQIYSAHLIKGDLIAAFDYVRKFPEQIDLVNRYVDVFENKNEMNRTDNKVINEVDKIYQKYYRKVFWDRESKEKAEAELFTNLWEVCGSNEEDPKDYKIEEIVEKLVQGEGYEFLGGKTAGYYGPYIWASSKKEVYQVELPYGNELYSIIMMDGFVSRSWLDFLSFGSVGTGGWVGKDGTLCCVKSVYDLESSEFKISFLKHEAQHSLDKKTYPNITSEEMEYRAKLVELIYWEDETMIKRIHLEADNRDKKNAHSRASHKIIANLSKMIFDVDYEHNLNQFTNKLSEIKTASSELLNQDTSWR